MHGRSRRRRERSRRGRAASEPPEYGTPRTIRSAIFGRRPGTCPSTDGRRDGTTARRSSRATWRRRPSELRLGEKALGHLLAHALDHGSEGGALRLQLPLQHARARLESLGHGLERRLVARHESGAAHRAHAWWWGRRAGAPRFAGWRSAPRCRSAPGQHRASAASKLLTRTLVFGAVEPDLRTSRAYIVGARACVAEPDLRRRRRRRRSRRARSPTRSRPRCSRSRCAIAS